MARARQADLGGLAVWLLSFALVAYLGLRGGGYDPLVHNPVGLAAWWLALAAVLVGALPRRGLPGPVGLTALALLTAFAAWTALSLVWTESVENTWAELARVVGYLGIFALALLARGPGEAPRIVGGVAGAIAAVSVVALLSRLHPAWFSAAGETAIFVTDSRERLSYPLNYWNGLGALIAIGLPLLLHCAAVGRSLLLRGLAAAAIPALVLTAFYTLSRGGIGAAAIAVALYLTLASDRLPKLLLLGVTGVGGMLLVAAADGRDALQEGLRGPLGQEQGDEMMMLAALACACAGLFAVALGYVLDRGLRPAWTEVPRRAAGIGAAVGAVALLIFAVAFGAPGRAADGWDEFRAGGGPGTGTERLTSVAGQSRYEFWRTAVDQNASAPLIGTGPGTFEFWWARAGSTDESVRDTHSLYMQTLGELGIVGLALLVALLGTLLVGGAVLALRGPPAERSVLAAAVAGATAFCVTASFDWMWQLPVLPAAMLLLGAAAVGVRGGAARRAIGYRIGFAVVAVVAIVAIAVPLAMTGQLRESEAEARDGELTAALSSARTAASIEPGAAGPRLQEALVLEEMGAYADAGDAARAATEREPTNWRTWFVLARVEAQAGRAAAAVAAYERARSLYPRSSLFRQE